jgi:uncharacterized protein YndB with AHSA1/START domain
LSKGRFIPDLCYITTFKSAVNAARCGTVALKFVSMEKYKFVTEFELRSSPKVLFPYISTASGLEQWFAEKVTVLPDHRYDFQWDGDSHIARQTSLRINKAVRFDFENTSDDNQDNNFLELKLEVSELTQTTFLRVIDYSANRDQDELNGLWDGFLESLREIVGS